MTDAPLTPATLWQWADANWLRRLDAALAQWVLEHEAQASGALLATVALLSHMEGKGHTCLPLTPAHTHLSEQLPALLNWPPEAQEALRTLQNGLPSTNAQWLNTLQASPLVWMADSGFDYGQPFVLTQSPAGAGSSAQKTVLRLYLRRYWQYEKRVAQSLIARIHAPVAVDAARAADNLGKLFEPASGAPEAFNWQKAACAMALRSQIAIITGGPGTGKTYTAARLLAAALAQERAPEQVRIGLAAPTGKAAARLKESIEQALEQLPCSVTAQAPLQKALSQLPAARTLHALLGARPDTRQMRYNASHPLTVDWLIVDEASMIHLEMMHHLLEALPPTARLILLGDKDQLASVEAGSVLGDLCAHAERGHYSEATADYLAESSAQRVPAEFLAAHGSTPPALAQSTVMLRESRRFGGEIGQLAQAVNQGQHTPPYKLLGAACRDIDSGCPVYWHEGASLGQAATLALRGRRVDPQVQPLGTSASYADLATALLTAPRWPRKSPPPDPEALSHWQSEHAQWCHAVLAALARFRILCATREGDWGVSGMNAQVIAGLRDKGVAAKSEGWFPGRVVQVTQNDANLGVFNGDVGICLPGADDRTQLRVFFPQENTPANVAPRSIAVTRMAHVETAFAMTIHKSQGSEFEHVLMVLPEVAGSLLSKELVYTGLTRARQTFSYLAPVPGVWQQAVAQKTIRASGLADTLQALL